MPSICLLAFAKRYLRSASIETTILMHNDAVVQGLSEAPSMRDVDNWAAFTIGTGLGNALYKNREQ